MTSIAFYLFVAAVLCLTFVTVLSAVKLVLTMAHSVTEDVPAANIPFGETGKTSVSHTGLNKGVTLDATSAAGTNVTACLQGALVMTAGAVTLNLAAGPGLAGPTAVDLTGLKLRSVIIRAKVANVNPITIAKGAANGYTGLGAAFSLTLAPGKEAILEPDSTAVAAGVRTFDVTGTGAQGLDIIITAGNN